MKEIIQKALEVIDLEAKSISQLKDFIDDSFYHVIECIEKSKGRLVVTGIGKSALIGQKMVATFNSTGTPSIFMHAADAIHGDLGIIQKEDVVLCISNSGETSEVKVLIPFIKQYGNPIIAITGGKDSFLSKQANYTLLSYVEKEACPHNLAPTTSTTAQLVLGDVLAVCLLLKKGFSSNDFAKYHPGGSLGKKLYLKVKDLSEQNAKPQVNPNTEVKQVLIEITSNRLGVVAVLDQENIIGIITDGDIRRMLQKDHDINHLFAKDIMSISPKNIDREAFAVEAGEIIKTNKISQLLVTKEGKFDGFVHIHDLLREGII